MSYLSQCTLHDTPCVEAIDFHLLQLGSRPRAQLKRRHNLNLNNCAFHRGSYCCCYGYPLLQFHWIANWAEMWHATIHTWLGQFTKITDPSFFRFRRKKYLPCWARDWWSSKKEEARGFLLLVLHSTKGEWGSVHSLKGCLRKYKFRMLTLTLRYRSTRSIFFNQSTIHILCKCPMPNVFSEQGTQRDDGREAKMHLLMLAGRDQVCVGIGWANAWVSYRKSVMILSSSQTPHLIGCHQPHQIHMRNFVPVRLIRKGTPMGG